MEKQPELYPYTEWTDERLRAKLAEQEEINQPWQNEAGKRRVGRQVIHIVQEQMWRYAESRPLDVSEVSNCE